MKTADTRSWLPSGPSAWRRRCALGSGLIIGLWAGLAAGQTHPEPTEPATGAEAPEPTSAPDVVHLRNGSFLRGTISERMQGEYVVIVTATGEARRFGWAEVEYAGPASRAPEQSASAEAAPAATPPAQPPAPAADPGGERSRPMVQVRAREAVVQMRGSEPGLTFHYHASTAEAAGFSVRGYSRICTAPCEAALPEGTFEMALSRPGEGPRRVSDPVAVPGAGTLEGEMVSRSALRAFGWVLIVASPIAGYFIFASAFEEKCETSDFSGGQICTTEVSTGPLYLGLAVFAGGLATGIVLATRKDVAEIRFVPGSYGALPSRGQVALTDPSAEGSLPYAPGFSLVGRF
jgi:hypothetical protein